MKAKSPPLVVSRPGDATTNCSCDDANEPRFVGHPTWFRQIRSGSFPLLLLVLLFHAGVIQAQVLTNAFFAMDTGTRDATHQTPEQQVALVKELGFAGIGPDYHNLEELKQWVAAVDQAHVRMFALYVPLHLDAVESSLKSLREIADLLKGHDTFLWLYVQDAKHPASSTENDGEAVKALRALAEIARASGLRVALYPHTGFYVQRVEDAARLAALVDRPNLGITFNLCHWLMVDGKDLEASLQAAKPYLLIATISGADRGGKSWSELIRPLDQGTYDVSQVLKALRKVDFTGPVGLQHYGVKGEAAQNLRHSLAGWKALQTQMNQ